MNNKVKFKGPMKHFMRWPLYLSVLVVLLDLLVFIVSVKAGILVSVGTVIYIFIAVQLFRYHKPLIINDMIAFANQYGKEDAGRTGTSLCHYGYGRPYDLVQPDLFGDHGQRSVL